MEHGTEINSFIQESLIYIHYITNITVTSSSTKDWHQGNSNTTSVINFCHNMSNSVIVLINLLLIYNKI